MPSVHIRQITSHREAPRLWLQDELNRAGFVPGAKYHVEHDTEKKALILRLCDQGSRAVTPKPAKGGVVGVIDLNSHKMLGIFAGMNQVNVLCTEGVIVIRPTKVAERKAARLARLRDELAKGCLSTGSISHGIGMMDWAVSDGLAQAGFQTRTGFLNEIRDDLVALATAHNSDRWDSETLIAALPIQTLAYDPEYLRMVPECSIGIVSLPCSGASVAGRAKKGTSMPEEHDLCGHLIAPFLAVAAQMNSAVYIFENVVPYASSASMAIMRTMFREWGYELHETTLDAWDFGAIEARKRLCMVAVTTGLQFDWSWVKPAIEGPRARLADILEDVPQGDSRWSEMAGLRQKEIRDREAGKSFAMQIFGADADKVGVLGKGYGKVRSTEPKILSPYGDGLLRQLTPLEHARLKNFGIDKMGDASATMIHECLGQGVVTTPFIEVAKQGVARTLQLFMGAPAPAVEAFAANDDFEQLELFA